MTKTCLVCDEPYYSVGYCVAHYQRSRRHGDPLGGRRNRTQDEFWKFVEVGDCWDWTGHVSVGGYGKIRWACFDESYTHRVAWTMLVGPIPDGLFLDHLCRNRTCCNPDHLEVVTHQENMDRGFSPTMVVSKSGVCRRGHPQTLENTYPNSSKKQPSARACAICKKERRHARRTSV